MVVMNMKAYSRSTIRDLRKTKELYIVGRLSEHVHYVGLAPSDILENPFENIEPLYAHVSETSIYISLFWSEEYDRARDVIVILS